MKKIIIITILLLITTIALAALYFSNLFINNRNSSKVLGYIPADAALILQFTNDNSFYEIFKEYSLFNNITGKIRENELNALTSSFLNTPQVAGLIDQQKVFLSFHTERDSVSFLWLTMLNDKISLADLGNTNGKFRIATDTAKNIFKISLPRIEKPFFIYIDGTLALGSFSMQLLQKSINKQADKINEAFIREISDESIKNKNSLVNLYFYLDTFREYLSRYFKDTSGGNFTLMNGLKGVSALNMNFKSDALMFNGITKTDSTTPGYLTLFLNQDPVKNTLMRIVPSSTSSYVLFGLSNYQRFNTDLKTLFKRRKQLDKLTQQIQTIADENGINPERDIKGLWGNEFITFQLANHEKLAAIKVTNGRQLDFLLEPLSQPAAEKIRRINYPDIFYFYFGDALQAFRKPYYFISDNIIFLANSSGALQRFNRQYAAEHFLCQTDRYINFEQLVADQSNITLFIHNNNSRSIIRTELRPSFAKAFSDLNYKLNDFYGFSYQWSSNREHFFTNLYISPNIEPLHVSDDLAIDSIGEPDTSAVKSLN